MSVSANEGTVTWEERLDHLQVVVNDVWVPRLSSPDTPAEGSDLSEDNKVFPRLPCSLLAWWGLSVATEHLDATVRLLAEQCERGGPLFPGANYSLLRGVLIGASHAAVLLLPESREVRTTHALQIAHEEYTQAHTYRRAIVNHPGLVPEAKAAADSQDFLAGYRDGIDETKRLLLERGIKRPKLTDTDIIKRAAALVHPEGEEGDLLQLAAEMEWRAGSGSAHGRLLMALNRPGGYEDQGAGKLATGATLPAVAQAIVGASLVLDEAWRSWDRRRSVE